MTAKFDHTQKDAMAMPVQPMDIGDFDLARYEAFAAEADQRYAAFLTQKDGVAVFLMLLYLAMVILQAQGVFGLLFLRPWN